MGRLSHARDVQHQRNAGWPNGREPHGHGVSVVVRGGESPPHGEGRQVVGRPRRQGTRDANRRNGLGSHPRTEFTAETTGELLEIERLTSSLEGGGGNRTQPVIRKDLRTPASAETSPAAYPTSRPDPRGPGGETPPGHSTQHLCAQPSSGRARHEKRLSLLDDPTSAQG